MFTVKKIHNIVFSNCITKNSHSNAGSQLCNTTHTTVTHLHHLIGGASKEGLVTLSSGYHYRRSLKQRAYFNISNNKFGRFQYT